MMSVSRNAQKWGGYCFMLVSSALISVQNPHCTRRGTKFIANCVPEHSPASQNSALIQKPYQKPPVARCAFSTTAYLGVIVLQQSYVHRAHKVQIGHTHKRDRDQKRRYDHKLFLSKALIQSNAKPGPKVPRAKVKGAQ